MKGMIFAAGLGTRLKPFTLEHPKALAPVKGVPALEWAIQNLAQAGIKDIIINVHHFAEQIVEYLSTHPHPGLNITISDETSRLLDTGGALAKVAREHGCSPLLVCNADIITNLPLAPMIQQFQRHQPDALLLAAKRESSRQLYFSRDNILLGWQNLKTGETRPADFTHDNTMKELAFGGIHIVGEKLLNAMAQENETNPVFGIIPFYLSQLGTMTIEAYTPTTHYCWHDIGRPETLAIAQDCPNHQFHQFSAK